jgi:uncharacterized membrane protein YgaE (UPF0421/DUF939 family)
MAAMHMPHPMRNHPDAARSALDLFWALAIGVIAAYAFFAALGAFSPGDVAGVTIGVGILVVLCVVRVVIARRTAQRKRDPRMVHARERRGF